MDSDSPDWSLYRSFLSVLRTGSLSAAARDGGLTQPTVGRHIDTLEKALGVALFTRSQQGLAQRKPPWSCSLTRRASRQRRQRWFEQRWVGRDAWNRPNHRK